MPVTATNFIIVVTVLIIRLLLLCKKEKSSLSFNCIATKGLSLEKELIFTLLFQLRRVLLRAR